VLYRAASDPGSTTDQPARIGFVVSRQVGPAVVRNRVKRRLRHQAAARAGRLSSGALYVVRANPAAATATSSQLGEALDACLDKVER
jgi:ribonuclease P protein component